jgi:hypothetical protein
MKKVWKDESGLVIPAKRITQAEKLKEATCDKLLKKALRIQVLLVGFKEEISIEADKVFTAVMEENGGTLRENWKGNFTVYNFDRSIKIEVSMQDQIRFDDALIEVAKQHFDTFLQSAAGSAAVDEMIRDMITDAFNTSRGRLDTRKVLGLISYRQRIPKGKYPHFHMALDAIEKGTTRTFSKKYHRISVRGEDGKYEAVDLNFSSL